jgi:ketosteroid isomerase-like protein
MVSDTTRTEQFEQRYDRPVTFDELDRWLDVYGRAWERHDLDGFVSCFAEDAVYHWGPYSEPLRGLDEIRARTEQAIASQGEVHFGHEPLAITPDGRGIARWWVSIQITTEGTIEEDEGIFLVTLAPDGRCTEFREWWNSRSRPA